MTLAEKLTTIAENQQKVYDAGFVNGQLSLISSAEALQGKETGEAISVNDVSTVEHSLGVVVKSRNQNHYFKDRTAYGLTFTAEDNGSTLVINGTVNELTTTSTLVFSGLQFPTDTYVVTYIFENMPTITGASYITTRFTWSTAYFRQGNGLAYSKTVTGAFSEFMMAFNTDMSGVVFENAKIKCLIAKASDITQPEVFTPYIPDLSGVNVIRHNGDVNNVQVVQTNADGTVEGLTSIHPSMTLVTNTEGAVINLNYYKDIDLAFENLKTQIALSGGE